ncbi:MAG: VCBS repeat-containing protein [Myxococcales bacterium]|nr:VCBS repeat-containing protein [Myxococcales bacterium]
MVVLALGGCAGTSGRTPGSESLDGGGGDDRRLYPVRQDAGADDSYGLSLVQLLDVEGRSTLADVDGDGVDELVCSSAAGSGGCLFGLGSDGTLGPLEVTGDPGGPLRIAVDVNGDGRADVVRGTAEGVATLLARETGGFEAPILSTGPVTERLHALDLNADGALDLLGLGAEPEPAVFSYMGDGRGGFAPQAVFEQLGQPYPALAVGEVTGDGLDDVLLLHLAKSGLELWVHPHDGSSGLMPEPRRHTIAATVELQYHLSIGDVNDDGLDDVLVSGAFPGVAVFTQGQDGSLQRAPAVAILDRVMVTAVVDANGDGASEVAITQPSGNLLRIFAFDEGRYQERARVGSEGSGAALPQLATGDLDGDGCPELVTSRVAGTSVFRGLCRASP